MTLITSEPPAFPRIPHLPGSACADDDIALGSWPNWLTGPVWVEEKLDGANVAIWRSGASRFEVAGRAGVGAMDRGRQLGRLRAWVHEHHAKLHKLLPKGDVLYGEWLWKTHSVNYDALPDWLIVLDLWSPEGFVDAVARNDRAGGAGLAVPAPLHHGPIPSAGALERLCGRSAYGSELAEGLIIRQHQAGLRTRIAKWVRPDFVRRSDQAWRQGSATYNRLKRVEPVDAR